MAALDTTKEAETVQLQIHRRLGPEGRFRVALEMSEAMLKLAEVGIRHRAPGYTDDQVREALLGTLFGFEEGQP